MQILSHLLLGGRSSRVAGKPSTPLPLRRRLGPRRQQATAEVPRFRRLCLIGQRLLHRRASYRPAGKDEPFRRHLYQPGYPYEHKMKQEPRVNRAPATPERCHKRNVTIKALSNETSRRVLFYCQLKFSFPAPTSRGSLFESS